MPSFYLKMRFSKSTLDKTIFSYYWKDTVYFEIDLKFPNFSQFRNIYIYKYIYIYIYTHTPMCKSTVDILT